MDPIQNNVMDRLTPVVTPAQKLAKARDTAMQFEQIFVRQLVSTMRESSKVDSEAGGMFGSEPGSDTYGDWFDEKIAEQVSKNGKVGIAAAVMRDFERWNSQPTEARGKTADEIDRGVLNAPHLPVRMAGGLDVAG
jgi:Rod binding domain-containing protein